MPEIVGSLALPRRRGSARLPTISGIFANRFTQH